jgi:inosine/xanthosine triphosphate pyrophosphatase family protein
LLQRLFTSTSKEYAKKARIIANDAGLSDVEKLHSLATLSAVHAAEAKDSEEKETYTRLNENFLKRAQAIEERSVDQAIADDAITFPAGEPEERQAGYVEAASN